MSEERSVPTTVALVVTVAYGIGIGILGVLDVGDIGTIAAIGAILIGVMWLVVVFVGGGRRRSKT